MKKIIGILLILVIQQATLFGQNNWENKYSIAYGNKVFDFEIENKSSCYIIKYKTNIDKDPYIDTISSIYDQDVFNAVILKDIVKTIKEKNDSINISKDISNKLYVAYLNRLQLDKLKASENDKGSNIGVVNLKSTTVNAYLLSRRKVDRKYFHVEKKQWNKTRDSMAESSEKLYQDSLKIYHNLIKNKQDSIKYNNIISGLKVRNDERLVKQKENMKDGKLYQVHKGITNFIKLKKQYRNLPDLLKCRVVPVLIDSVDMAFENGIIKDVHVIAKYKQDATKVKKDGFEKDAILYFSNWGYIPVRNAQDIDVLSCKERNYLSFLYKNDSLLVIDLSDIVNYNRKVAFSSGTYIPKDTTITITDDENEKIMLKKPSMLENFDMSIYTDANGYSGKTPNGIVQAEAQLNFNLNQGRNRFFLYKIWRKKELIKNKPIYRFQFLTLNKVSP
jgi:hypothetical protein